MNAEGPRGRRTPPPGPCCARVSALCFDRAEQTVRLAGRSCGEEQRGRRSGRAVVAELQRPQPLDHDGVAVDAVQAALVLELVSLRLEDVDHTVAEVRDQQIAA